MGGKLLLTTPSKPHGQLLLFRENGDSLRWITTRVPLSPILFLFMNADLVRLISPIAVRLLPLWMIILAGLLVQCR
jgi:hypothetical protein